VPDAIFADPRLASVYDVVDDDRSDLDVYAEVVDELGASSVLDVGCGTGSLACRLASAGKEVVGLDPAQASLDVARAKPGADRVRWVHGDVTSLPLIRVDLALMTGNVAMVFLTDEDWAGLLTGVRRVLRERGWFVFETRDPERRDWERWTRDVTFRSLDTTTAGRIDTWVECTDVRPPLVSFRHTFRFQRSGAVVTSDSTLRFRTIDEVTESLHDADLHLRELRDAPDRATTSCRHLWLQRGP
jgi:ubiquinone/menaquinone biosynthesis C-methylase UbiE